jgi:hypothetical protein
MVDQSSDRVLRLRQEFGAVVKDCTDATGYATCWALHPQGFPARGVQSAIVLMLPPAMLMEDSQETMPKRRRRD